MAELSGLSTITESPSNDKIRVTKRKLDDAFHVLDGAVNHSETSVRPTPPKRSNTIKSLYSTLAKYGIKTKEPSSAVSAELELTKRTPHLSAILSRAASKTKSTFTFRFSSNSPSPAPLLSTTAEYRPSSLPSFLSRLGTYKLSTYANKPTAIDAVAASKCGWVNDGKDRLVCGLCNASWVVAGREGLSRDAANTLLEKQRVSLVEAHKNGCPWKTRQCDDAIYCIPLMAPGAMIRELQGRAAALEPTAKDILIKHPLTATQLNALRSTVASYSPPNPPPQTASKDVSMESHQEALLPSETPLLAALFGWSLVPPAPPPTLRRASTMRSASGPPSPALSRASSVSLPRTPPRQKTPAPSNPTTAAPSTSTPISATPRPLSDLSFRIPSTLMNKPENTLLQCELCQRRIGLWAFSTRKLVVNGEGDTPSSPVTEINSTFGIPGTPSTRPKKPLPQRAFDLLKEHRSYCPYTVKSTVIPSLSSPPQATTNIPATPSRSSLYITSGSSTSISQITSRSSLERSSSGIPVPGAVEGWRAVLMVVLRYGMAEKQRMEYNFLTTSRDPEQNAGASGRDEDAMDVDNVKAMVSGVKARGGKDLLRYVKGLLG
ncbi:C3HC zinc finger-like-domain-containing protein [Crepidotus variabilis]|uniref:C3HC zinc finger-like-domain-containing protein n=1 Tax=Crepidotus variabilis TaxID=179855 RepID=A0A9P6JI74_9AGAR|nr:C3HC zinc finger-like-domain-containing protein [Crepidotus variabilis]